MDQTEFKPRHSIFTAIGLFIFDAFVMNQGAIAIIALLVVVLWLLPKSALLKFKKESSRVPLTKVAIYSVMALAIFSANFANNKIARYRAENLISAIEKYHQSTSIYPDRLTDLIPIYIPSVPIAKYALLFSEFRYINYQGNVSLYYVAIPPFGRPTYSFNRKSWGYID